MAEKELYEIAIAALLHDAGKAAQRAGIKELYDEGLLAELCGGDARFKHAVLTQKFIEKNADVFPDSLDAKRIAALASRRCKPAEWGERLIAQGDRLSSGSDRCSLAESDNADERQLKFYEKPMRHIISAVHIKEMNEPVPLYCRLRPLEEDAVIGEKGLKVSQEDYRKLWQKFEADFRELKGHKSAAAFVDALDFLLKRYWWCIPSATNAGADVSLYQHARTTAAFASALYLFHKEGASDNQQSLEDEECKKFLFVKGDVSGIQRYIFDLKTTKDSAKRLRAKSFHIAALEAALSSHIAGRLGLTKANVVTSSGGNFILLLPNTKSAKEELAKIQLEAERYFLKEFAAKLAVIISDGTPASQRDVQSENVPKLINDIGYAGDVAKQKKMQRALFEPNSGEIFDKLYSDLQASDAGECPCCGILPSQGADADGEPCVCKNCEKLEEIGRDLVKNSFIQISGEKLLHFGQMVHLSRKCPDKSWASINTFEPGQACLFMPYSAPHKDGNEDGELLTFEEIAQIATGNKKLAMLKADVDNLGLIFSSGFYNQSEGRSRMSFSRYAELSYMLQYFFSGFYSHFVQTESYYSAEKGVPVLYKDAIYTVFSGGDDLCVLGPWDAVMQFAQDFHAMLDKFTGGNPSVHLSAGIALASSNVPVRTIAAEAEDALELSKARKDGNREDSKTIKDAVTVFGTTVGWEEYADLLKKGMRLEECLENGKLSSGVVRSLLGFADRAQKIDEGNCNMRNFLWASNMHYVIARNVKDEKLKNDLLGFGASKEAIKQSRVAASYALYTQRRN